MKVQWQEKASTVSCTPKPTKHRLGFLTIQKQIHDVYATENLAQNSFQKMF